MQEPMPQIEHSAFQTELAGWIDAMLRRRKVARAFLELRCTFGDRSIVPDISVFTWNRIPRNENGVVANVFSIAPDWAIEILSPDQSQTKLTKNLLHCLKHQTQMGWLIDSAERSVFVYRSDRSPEVFDRPEAQLPTPEFAKKFSLTVKDLFDWILVISKYRNSNSIRTL